MKKRIKKMNEHCKGCTYHMENWCRSTSSKINVEYCIENNFKKVHEEPKRNKKTINAFHYVMQFRITQIW